MKPDELRDEIAIQLEALEATVGELLTAEGAAERSRQSCESVYIQFLSSGSGSHATA